MLKIVNQFKKIFFCRLELGGFFIGDAHQFEGIIHEAALYIIILYAFNFYFAVYAFKFFVVDIRRKMNGRNFN